MKRRLFVFFLFSLKNLLLFSQQSSSLRIGNFDPNLLESRRHFVTAMALYQNNNFNLSIDYFLRSLKKDSKNLSIRYFLGLAYYHAGYTQSAVSQWENIMKLSTSDNILQQKIDTAFFLQTNNSAKNSAHKDTHFSFIGRFMLDHLYDVKKKRGFFIKLPTDIYVDDHNEITVMDARTGALVKIDRQGELKEEVLNFAAQSFFGSAKLKGPSDFILMKDKSYIISDFVSDRIVWIDADGKVLSVWDNEKKSLVDSLKGPRGLSLDVRGNIWVANSSLSEIKKYNQKGLLLHKFGSRGQKDGQFRFPNDVFFHHKDEKIYVVDRGNKRIQRFDRNGRFEKIFGSGILKNPQRLAADPYDANKFIVLDTDQVYRLDVEKNKMTSLLLETEQDKKKNRSFLSFSFDKQGKLYVGNAEKMSIDYYAPTDFFYSNLNLHFENVDLQKFPKVIVQVSVKDQNRKPISDMDVKNFQILENGLRKSIKMVFSSKGRERFRPIVLVEKSLEAKKNKNVIEGFLKRLLIDNKQIDRTQLVGYGGKEGNYEKISNFSNLYYMAIKKLLDAEYHQDFSLEKALHASVNFSISHSYRKAIIIFAFSPHTQKQLSGENFQLLVDFAFHNHVPIYVVYGGASLKKEDSSLKYLEMIAQRTGGHFYVYNQQTIADLLEDMHFYEDGVYRFIYESAPNPLRKGFFRSLDVRANYHGLVGIDDKGGYAIP